jgi:hypothetical protein
MMRQGKQMTDENRRNQEPVEAEAERNRAQRALDRAWQRMRDLEEEDRRIHRQLDPFNWGHWN